MRITSNGTEHRKSFSHLIPGQESSLLTPSDVGDVTIAQFCLPWQSFIIAEYAVKMMQVVFW